MMVAPSLLALSLATLLPQDLSTFEGHWEGRIVQAGLEIEVDLLRSEEGEWSGDISIPIQKLFHRDLVNFEFQDDALSFEIEGIPGKPRFEARHAEGDTDTLEGPFRQGATTLRFELERAVEGPAMAPDAVDGIAEWIESARAAWDVPGVAVAIVSKDEVIMTRGFGIRREGGDDDAPEAVDEETLFAIGSSTKAFTTLALAIAVEDSDLSWSDKVENVLPGFALSDARASEEIDVRDLVTHRSGLPRHDLMWYGRPGRDVAEIIAGMRHLELTYELRETFQYNNLGFVVAGEVLREATGLPWSEFLEAKVLAPLGMTRSGTTSSTYAEASNRATGHDREDDETRALPFRDIDLVGPAGSIVSSAADMAHWARFQLSDGEFGGKRIVDTDTLVELHTPQMAIRALPSDPMIGISALAHGWFVDSYRGHLRVQHGGNIDGFTAMVAVFPLDDLAVCVLCNMNATPLAEFTVRHVADTCFDLEPRDWSGEALSARAKGEEVDAAKAPEDTAVQDESGRRVDPPRTEGTTPAHPLAVYAGAYEHPAYGTIVVRPTHGEPDDDSAKRTRALEVVLGDLDAELEHWHFESFRAGRDSEGERSPLTDLMLRFETSVEGDVTAVHAKLEPSVAPLRFEAASDPSLSDPGVLEKFAGTYGDHRFEITFELRGEKLWAVVANQPSHFLVPERNDRFSVDQLEGFAVQFLRDDEGEVDRVELRQPQGNFVIERVED